MIVSPGPALQGWREGASKQLAYERSIEEAVKSSEAAAGRETAALPSQDVVESAPEGDAEDLTKRDAWAAVSPEHGVDGQITVTEDEMGAEERTVAEPELVQVMVSGAEMRSEATDEAPLLFAFPYGRTLHVVSRGEDGWVEVTDPKSGATGWMKAAFLAVPRYTAPQRREAAYDSPWRRGWWRRQRGGVSDFFQAFGGF